MNIKHIKNGSLYKDTSDNTIWRVRSKANTSSVWVTHHSNKPELVKASDLVQATQEECDAYLDSNNVELTSKAKVMKMLGSAKFHSEKK
tara:strand:+ start:896 stop:1162 length:267 start_codon:yes stop_codon:yes gene_type:complete